MFSILGTIYYRNQCETVLFKMPQKIFTQVAIIQSQKCIEFDNFVNLTLYKAIIDYIFPMDLFHSNDMVENSYVILTPYQNAVVVKLLVNMMVHVPLTLF